MEVAGRPEAGMLWLRWKGYGGLVPGLEGKARTVQLKLPRYDSWGSGKPEGRGLEGRWVEPSSFPALKPSTLF